jgi:predicted ATPase/class 3 adenylate cyclase
VRSELPRGTVTFLFTDVEGSTRLLRELGAEEYAAVLAAHREAVREACVAQGGAEVDTQGDAFFFAFAEAGAAVAAATDAQGRLAKGPLRVRMGIHSGEPYLTDEGYVGEEVHRGARIAAAGHGGQVLVSKEARSLAGLELTDLGEHRVKDFAEPVWLYQVGGEHFPPLRTLSNTNLPRPASSFVGREREIAEVVALLRNGGRLVTLGGPGGSGKTRLAIEAAAELLPRFANGVFWVGLANLSDHALVLATIAETLGATEELPAFIGARELLLLLDNLEQVVAVAPELADLLEACPNLRLLVTSRELLRVRGEVIYPVPPLAEAEAVELFCLRSRLERSPEVEQLCSRLDNLPLGVELAAARTAALSPAQILQRLGQRLDLLEGGRDAEARQRTLRATIAWSYDLLEPAEQQLFAALAVFRGGCTLEAAEEVASATVATLQSLVEKSLLRHTHERFWMLETIRELALERLAERPDTEGLGEAHARWIFALAQTAGPELGAAGATAAIHLLDSERDNIRGALEWAYDRGNAALALAIAAPLERYWWTRGPNEAHQWLERGVGAPGVPDDLRVDVLGTLGGTAYFTGDVERSIELFLEGLDLARALGDRLRTARMLARLGPPHYVAGRAEEGARYVEEAVAINRDLGYGFGLVESLHILSGAYRERGDLAGSQELIEESLRIAREIGDDVWIANDLALLAYVLRLRGDLERAWELERDALAGFQQRNDPLHVLGSVAELAVIAALRDDPPRAALLWGAVERLDEELGPSLFATERDELAVQLGDVDEALVAEGRSLPLEQVLERTLHEPFAPAGCG